MDPFVLAGQGRVPERNIRHVAGPRRTHRLWIRLEAIARNLVGVIGRDRRDDQRGGQSNNDEQANQDEAGNRDRGLEHSCNDAVVLRAEEFLNPSDLADSDIPA